MPTLSLISCFNDYKDHKLVTGPGTRIWNFTGKPIELQVNVRSISKKVNTLKAGSSKRSESKIIYKAYMPKGGGNGVKNLLCYFDETFHPYIWIHDAGCDFSRMLKQQYISIEDLRDCSEIRVFRDHQEGMYDGL